jgi:Icc-related predicted phosphoesterase
MKKRITLISDTHNKHGLINISDLPGGDILIHAGDIMNSGYNPNEVKDFCYWYSLLNQYHSKIFIAGNHDRFFENNPNDSKEIYENYKEINYLQDKKLTLYNDEIKIYGSPWQPEFYNWAFNLPKNGQEIMAKWQEIPSNTDILITHGPPIGILDTSGYPYNETMLGCSLLKERVDYIKPKIHVFGHIHGSAGYIYQNGTHFFNASLLNEEYKYVNKPITFDWETESNTIEFV